MRAVSKPIHLTITWPLIGLCCLISFSKTSSRVTSLPCSLCFRCISSTRPFRC
ncbi:hypothetical protein PF007_g12404 [Phytophthora fragariae]|uniref:RxLR effector protein n=1 Tax=Phytophthora fragariae TaxID=53985 RepID=A0A6A4DD80_9STRA|nr:hypothetical protein PF007_g12404 [Phytophthora fragariae]KAE9305692.1 hypothetical protein PF001_g12486 [Phytophthora fragariae]